VQHFFRGESQPHLSSPFLSLLFDRLLIVSVFYGLHLFVLMQGLNFGAKAGAPAKYHSFFEQEKKRKRDKSHILI
jgi:hypothetical protein